MKCFTKESGRPCIKFTLETLPEFITFIMHYGEYKLELTGEYVTEGGNLSGVILSPDGQNKTKVFYGDWAIEEEGRIIIFRADDFPKAFVAIEGI